MDREEEKRKKIEGGKTKKKRKRKTYLQEREGEKQKVKKISQGECYHVSVLCVGSRFVECIVSSSCVGSRAWVVRGRQGIIGMALLCPSEV